MLESNEVMKEAMVKALGSWYFQDAFVLLLVGLSIWIGVTLGRREHWRAAFHQVFQRKLAAISFIMICLYTTVAVLDSVGYEDTNGSLTVLDRILFQLRDQREKTYSAPLADVQFTKEATLDEAGNVVRDYPPLDYPGRHVLGTDRVGNDVLYLSLKGVRTGMILGALTTILVVPFAILFGVVAGYFGGWIDDAIQYVYTVLASIPSYLLIVAFMVIFGRGLPQLCIIMGITSWTGLCRILRGETLKLRETEYVQAAEATGVSRGAIMLHHIVPNLMHIVLITAVLSFSNRVLAEAVLTYIGIGVGADTISWGAMINDALRELARSPIIWWKLVAAFIFMLGLVLPANIFGDAMRDALDPRLKTD
jgi:peptide/nickel transport system permease protein